MRALFVVLGLILVLAAAAGGGWIWFQDQVQRPLALESEQLFDLEPGTSVAGVARQVRQMSLSEAPLWVLPALVRLEDAVLKSGEYRLEPGMNLRDLVGVLASGRSVQRHFRIPEGQRWMDVRELVARHPGLDAAEFEGELRRLIAGSAWVDTLEGALLPDTYAWTRAGGATQLVRQSFGALEQALRQLTDTAEAPAILRLASMIEKEAGNHREMPLISSVFHNRLERGMRLQSDPTVIYGMGDAFDGNLRRADLERDTPWNTYTRAGLPPTPICLVSRAALRAAADPETSEFLYFVADGSGGHAFSRTLREHNRAVQRYLQWLRSQRE